MLLPGVSRGFWVTWATIQLGQCGKGLVSMTAELLCLWKFAFGGAVFLLGSLIVLSQGLPGAL